MIKRFLNRVTQTIKGRGVTLLLVLLPVFSLTGTAQENLLVPFEAQYTAYKWNDDVGHATITLSPVTATQYSLTYSSKVSRFFLSDKRYEHSIFEWNDNRFIPKEYHFTRKGTGPDKKLDVTFNKDSSGKIYIEQGEDYPWEGQFDNQLYRLAIGQQLSHGETSIEYDYVNYRGQIRSHKVVVIGEESVALPYGNINAVKVKLVRDNKSSRETFAWFAPELHFALVRLQQFKDGEEQGDIQLKAYKLL